MALCAVELHGRVGLGRHVHQLRRAGLHAVGHLVGVESGEDLRVADRVEPRLVELGDGVVESALALAGEAFRAVQVEDRIALATERHALEGRRQEAARPEGIARPRTARTALQDDESRQALGLAAEPVGDP